MFSRNDEQSFLNAMAGAGLAAFKSLDLIPDGSIHRYRVDGDKSGSLNGWYVLYVDGALSSGAFGSWKTGQSTTWCSKSESALSPGELEAWRQRRLAAQQAQAAEKLAVQREAAIKAADLWDKANFAVACPADLDADGGTSRVHPYIVAKGVKPFGVKQMGKSLMVPVRNASGQLTSLQFIQENGDKRFLTGGQVDGCYFAIGRHSSILCICEGFATGASIHEATGFAVAVAFNAGNLPAVARVMREKFPAHTIILCADDDYTTEGNPGLSKAQEAAGQEGGMVSVPTFEAHKLINGKAPNDFNDLHVLRGLEAVREAVESAIEAPKPPVVVEPAIAPVKKTVKDFEELIDDSDDFDWLTDELMGMLAVAELKRPAVEFLVAKAAKKAAVPKHALLEVLTAYGSNGQKKNPAGDDGKIDELNHKHAVIPIGGRVLILNREYEPVMDRQLLTFSAKTDFETRYCNRKVWDNGEEVGLGTYWMNHPRRAEFDGMVFSPGLDQPGYLNLWTGWGVEPKPGSCQKYLDFVRDVICSGDGALFDYIIYWCAHLVQRPQELPETALVFRGREGIGKNTFIDPLRDIVGREHFLMLSSLNQITGRFSGHLATALLVFCNESVWGGDKSAQGVLKSMITDDVQPIEYKGRDLTMVKSYRRMIMASNEDWVVPRGADDRRYVITDVSDARKGDYTYFQAIRDEMKNGGTEALMHYLLARDIKDWHPRKIPEGLQTCGWELKIRSGGSIVQWWFDLLQRGWIQCIAAQYSEEDRFVWPEKCMTDVVQKSYLNWCENYKIAHREHSVVIGKLIQDWGVKKCRPRTDNPDRREFYLIPSLIDAQMIFSERFSIPESIWESSD